MTHCMWRNCLVSAGKVLKLKSISRSYILHLQMEYEWYLTNRFLSQVSRQIVQHIRSNRLTCTYYGRCGGINYIEKNCDEDIDTTESPLANVNPIKQRPLVYSITRSSLGLKLYCDSAICGLHQELPKVIMNQSNFWYHLLMWTVYQWGCFASTGTNGIQKGHILGSKLFLTDLATWGRNYDFQLSFS